MKKRLTFLSFFVVFFIFFAMPQQTLAIEDPLKVPNNKFGIHILFDTELQQAANLVNSNGGDWGYVTIPIQSGDKNLVKWQKFMNEAKRLHLIPIIRLATEGDYFNTNVWRKATPEDVIDFANFLNSLDWPVKNRYVIVFNEVNRGDEWGGSVNPTEYAELLSYTVSVFKSKNPNFFIISSGMDNAAPNRGIMYMNQYDYLRNMQIAVPGIFNQIDGLASHSYPNPAFAQPPNIINPMGVASFNHEKLLIKSMSNKDLPVFITETGWASDMVPDEKIASYYLTALSSIWSDSKVVAVTPFLLQSAGGPFQKFTLLKQNGEPTKQYQAIKSYPKVRGMPARDAKILAARTKRSEVKTAADRRNFSRKNEKRNNISLAKAFQNVFEWVMKI